MRSACVLDSVLQVAFYRKNPKLNNMLIAETIEDATALGVARFLNRKCAAGITKVGNVPVTAEIPIDFDDL